jgi:hypothetical protein
VTWIIFSIKIEEKLKAKKHVKEQLGSNARNVPMTKVMVINECRTLNSILSELCRKSPNKLKARVNARMKIDNKISRMGSGVTFIRYTCNRMMDIMQENPYNTNTICVHNILSYYISIVILVLSARPFNCNCTLCLLYIYPPRRPSFRIISSCTFVLL